MDPKKVTIRDIQAKKGKEKWLASSVTDVSTARIMDATGVDVVGAGALVASMAIQGYPTTIQATLDQVLIYLGPIARSLKRSLLIATLPFGTYQASDEDTIHTAIAYMQAGADSVKIEGAGKMIDRIHATVQVGIPVMGHLGMAPMQIKGTGGYRAVGTKADEAKRLYEDALLVQEAGVWCMELECVPDRVAEFITRNLRVPTLGTGSGTGCDGQGLIANDVWGMPQPVAPRLAKMYGDLFTPCVEALRRFREDVKNHRVVPSEDRARMSDDDFQKFFSMVG